MFADDSKRVMDFRRAVRADLPALVAMLADDFLGATRERFSDPLEEGYIRAFEQIDADPDELLWVGALDGTPAAMLQLTFLRHLTYRGGLRAHIEGVRVRSDLRGSSVGTRLLSSAIEQARLRGCHLVQLTVDKQRPDAIRFYQKLGFRPAHEGMKMDLS